MSIMPIICALILILNINDLALAWGGQGSMSNTIKHDKARYSAAQSRVAKAGAKWPPSNHNVVKRRKALDSPIDLEDEPDMKTRAEKMPSQIKGSVKLPMYAAADYHLGEYLVDLDVGTPAQTLRLIVDIGSDLTWVRCKNTPPGNYKDERGFEAAKSSTFAPIPCSTTLCTDELKILYAQPTCPTINAPCVYNYSYGEGDVEVETVGMFGTETATLPTTTNETTKMEKFFIGCSEWFTPQENWDNVDGVLALGMNGFSFGIHAISRYGGVFSYCLVDHLSPVNVSSYLIFGDDKLKASTLGFMRYTSLVSIDGTPFHWVFLKTITVGKQMLNIPNRYWVDENGGTILDSGSTLTFLTHDAYRAVMDMLIQFLSKTNPRQSEADGRGERPFEYCFNSTEYPVDPSKVPRIDFHFSDGARFTPHVKSYIIDGGPDIMCVGILEAQGALNMIGNIMQQNYLWEFDLLRKTLGFAPSTCQ